MRRFEQVALSALLAACAHVCTPLSLNAQSTLLVDFGSSPSSNSFGLAGWSTVLASGNLEYTSDGPGGIRVARDPDEVSDFMGVRGTNRAFTRGERIVVTWYNTSADTLSFTARISFADSDAPEGGTAAGAWYTMRSFDDYRRTYTRIPPQASAKTAFNIESTGVHKTDGTAALVNINLTIEWGSFDLKPLLVCDRIELRNDADTQAPSRPGGLTAQPVSDSKIRLDWNVPADNTGVVEYLIYTDGRVEGYSRENTFTSVLLESNTAYTFTVSALDHCRNESAPSDPVRASTSAFQGTLRLIRPDAFQYLGAFRLPESANWGGEMLAFYPAGDGGPTGSGAADGFSGSLFTSNINTPDAGYVGEMSIPAPVITTNSDQLNEAVLLQAFTDIRPANVNAWPYVDIWQGDLVCIPEAGSSRVTLFGTWSYYYQVGGDKTASLASCDAAVLSAGSRYGAWFVGKRSEAPHDAALNDYLFKVPDAWAAARTGGRALITGRNREGGLSGLGPTLYAVAPAPPGSPPAADTELSATTLLQYGPVEGTDDYHFPHSFIGYNHADWFRGAEWISAGGQNAVGLIGNRARGNNWYGYTGERMLHDWVTADLPYPDFYATDPDGKGWRGHNKIPMLALYDPNELAAVAQGTIPAHQPQPYAAVRLDTALFFGPGRIIRESAFDPDHGLLFALEFVPEQDGRLIAHVWRVTSMPTSADQGVATRPALRLHPNPAGDQLTISADPAPMSVRIVDVLGREVWNGTIAGWRTIDISLLPGGMYAVVTEKYAAAMFVKR